MVMGEERILPTGGFSRVVSTRPGGGAGGRSGTSSIDKADLALMGMGYRLGRLLFRDKYTEW